MIPLRTEPLRQFFQVSGVHPSDKFLPVDVMNCKDVVCLEHDVITSLQAVQSSFNERIVHDAFEIAARAFGNSKVLTPATGRNILPGQRHE